MRRKYLLITAALTAGTVLVLAWPPPSRVLNGTSLSSQRILDRNGKVLYELHQPEYGGREYVPLPRMPAELISAVIATEDRGFYQHSGVSWRGIAHAAVKNLRKGRIVAGGSTITQQLVRMRLGYRRNSVATKLREVLLAWKLELRKTKEEILEGYLNEAFFGHRAYGVQQAAKTFFGKNAGELSLGESAFLAGVLQAPSSLDPFQNMNGARRRQKLVLDALLETKAISLAQRDDALIEPLKLAPDITSIRAPHFVFWLLSERKADVEQKTAITTTLDLSLQEEIERIIDRHLETLKDHNVTSAAVVVLDAVNGDVLAMVGSSDYFDEAHDGFVNVAASPRQPGSTIKPFTYALALKQGDTAATTVADIETQFLTQEGNPYVPRNYDFEEHGLVRYRDALANSYNIAAVRVLEKVGVPALHMFLREAGITSFTKPPQYYGLALTLGDAEVSLLELARAYAIFPREGRTLNLRTLLNDPLTIGQDILDARIAWLITDMLSDNEARMPEFGSDNPLVFDRAVAAKTGTTRNSRDNWTIGFTKERIIGVWVGNADNSPMRGTSGITGAGPIFHDALLAATREVQETGFKKPTGITEVTICRESGKLTTEYCTNHLREYFIEGTEPKEKDTIFQALLIDTRNGLLASETCDPKFIHSNVFAIFPPELGDWARDQGFATPPQTLSPLCKGQLSDVNSSTETSISIVSPREGDNFVMDPLIPDRDEVLILTAAASADISSAEWYINGKLLTTSRAPDFRAEWPLKEGASTIEIRVKELRDTSHVLVKLQS